MSRSPSTTVPLPTLVMREQDGMRGGRADPSWPRISIVTPSYNQAPFLEQAILSVLGQDYPNLEYMIVDGGSTDGSVEIIRRYERHLAWWVSEPDEGQSHAIEKGFARATGALLNWINSDDLLFPGALRHIATAWRARPDGDLFVGSNASCDADGRIWRISVLGSQAAICHRQGVIPIGQQSVFFSREIYQRIGGIRRDLHYVMDRDLYLRMLGAGGKLVTSHALIGAWRYHAGTKSASATDACNREIAAFLSANGISPRRREVAKWWMRLVRCCDGSYWRSWRLTRRLGGRTPAEIFDHSL